MKLEELEYYMDIFIYIILFVVILTLKNDSQLSASIIHHSVGNSELYASKLQKIIKKIHYSTHVRSVNQ